jgi:hypothetical protein
MVPAAENGEGVQVVKLKDYAALLGSIISLALAHHHDPVPTDVFLVLLLVIFIWLVIDWKFMSVDRRSALAALYKARRGIPRDEHHKIDELLKR